MKAEIKDNQLLIICENKKDGEMYDRWRIHNVRQYRHNTGEKLLCGLDINSVKRLNTAKPAYRVYLDNNGVPGAVTRFANGTYSNANTDNTKWISDWIEYYPK